MAPTLAAALQAELDLALATDASLTGIVATLRAPRLGLDWSGASGALARGKSEALTPTDAFRIASVTKPFTATVALRLHEQGRLPLFTPIDGLLHADVKDELSRAGYAPESITIHHLLTHSSGLRDHAGRSTSYAETLMRDPAHRWTHAEQLTACMSLGGPLSAPGTHFAYSDTGYLILGDIIERQCTQPLHLLMRQLLGFAALGLVQTHFERQEPTPAGQRRAGQYIGDVDVASVDCSCDLSGGGGLISTTGELVTWFRAAALGELFDEPQTHSLAMSTPSLQFTPPDVLHSALMRGRVIGLEPSWMHGGAWGLAAGYCPGSDISWALSFNQLQAGVSTVGVPGDPAQPGLADRLLTHVQRAVHTLHGRRR
jgi:D-alanyl-D-alanine carboxypeptidase